MTTNRTADLKSFLDLLEHADPENDNQTDAEGYDEFYRIIARAFELDMVAVKDITKEFGMSIPSVERWKNRHTAPHPAMRNGVYEWLANMVKNELSWEQLD